METLIFKTLLALSRKLKSALPHSLPAPTDRAFGRMIRNIVIIVRRPDTLPLRCTAPRFRTRLVPNYIPVIIQDFLRRASALRPVPVAAAR